MKVTCFLILFCITTSCTSQTVFSKFNEFVKDSSIVWANTFVTPLQFKFKNFSLYNNLFDKIINKNAATYDLEDLPPVKNKINNIDTLNDVIWEDNYVVIDHRRYMRASEDYKTIMLKYEKDKNEYVFIKETIYFKNNRLFSKPYLAMPYIIQFTADSYKYFPFPKLVGYVSVFNNGKTNSTNLISFTSSDTLEINEDYKNRAPQYIRRKFIVKEYFEKNFLHYIQDQIVNPNKFIRLNDSTQIVKANEADYYFYDKPRPIQVFDNTDTTNPILKDTLVYNDIYLLYTKTMVLHRKWTYDIINNTLTNQIYEVILLSKNEDYNDPSLPKQGYTVFCSIKYKNN